MTFDRCTSFRFFDPAGSKLLTLGAFSALGLLASASRADPPGPPSSLAVRTPPSVKVRPAAMSTVPLPSPEPDAATSGSAGSNPFGKLLPNGGQSLAAPVTVNANTGTDAITATQSGAGRAITGSVTSGSNALSAIKGITAGSGSGVNGVNSGIKGQAGKFENTNASTEQTSLLVTTVGYGTALQAVVKTTGAYYAPAVLGQHNASPGYGTGVQGEGGDTGVRGEASGGQYSYGVIGSSNKGVGTQGQSDTGTGLYGISDSGVGIQAFSYSNTGLTAQSSTSTAIVATGDSGDGVRGTSTSGYGVRGTSAKSIGLVAQSDSGYGLFATTNTGLYAGLFNGAVYVIGPVTAASYGYTSDRDLKQDFAAIDSADVLTRIAAMPITAWDYKSRPEERHIGPMAQDFRAAFGLGADERHIDVVDGIGVSLAAIKELQKQLQQKNEQIAAQASQMGSLQAELQVLHQTVDARFAALEQAAATAGLAITHP